MVKVYLKMTKRQLNGLARLLSKGNAKSQYFLGLMYASGKGVLKDLSKAKYWIKKAYENPDASASIIELAEEGWNQLELWKY